MNKKLLRTACIVVFFVWLVNALANQFYWYSAMWWFDIPMHIMGGMFLGFGAGAIFFNRLVKLSRHDGVVTILLFVLALGIGWEFFEYIVQALIKGGPQLANIPDSIKDVFMDIVGGSIATFFVLRAIRRYNRSHANTSH
jgi:hypothetical protein